MGGKQTAFIDEEITVSCYVYGHSEASPDGQVAFLYFPCLDLQYEAAVAEFEGWRTKPLLDQVRADLELIQLIVMASQQLERTCLIACPRYPSRTAWPRWTTWLVHQRRRVSYPLRRSKGLAGLVRVEQATLRKICSVMSREQSLRAQENLLLAMV